MTLTRRAMLIIGMMIGFVMGVWFDRALVPIPARADAHHTHRWVKVHGTIHDENEGLIGCGNYHNGHWSEGFWVVTLDDLRDVKPYAMCDQLVRKGVLP